MARTTPRTALRNCTAWVAPALLAALVSPVRAVDWFDDFSDGNADAPPVQWSPSPVFAGDYDASTGDYVLTPTDDPSQAAGTGDETLLATVDDVVFTDTSVRTRALVGFGDEPEPGRNADFDDSGRVGGEDFLIWQQSYDLLGFHEHGDANGDVLVTAADLEIWEDQFGRPPNVRGGNVGVTARFNTNTGDGYVLVIDDGSQWNLLAIGGFGAVQIPINDQEGENVPPIETATGEPINAASDLMIQLDVTNQGDDPLLKVWFWRPDEPMPEEPFFSRVDDFSGVAIDQGAAGILYNEDTANTPGIYRFVQASDVHLGGPVNAAAVPEPTTAALAILSVAAAWLVTHRSKGRRRELGLP